MKRLIWFSRHEDGATAVEYALMVTLIAGVIGAVVLTFGLKVNDLFIIPSSVFKGATP